MSNVIVYYYNPAIGWIPASQVDGWMVSRQDHPNLTPACIEIQVNHFSGVHAGISTIPGGGATGGDGGGGGCFMKSVNH